MTTHIDITLANGGSASVEFTAAPMPLSFRVQRSSGEDLASFQSGTPAAPARIPGGALRASAFYQLNGAWIPMDVDLIEDTAARASFRASAYVGSTLSPTGGGYAKLEAILTIAK